MRFNGLTRGTEQQQVIDIRITQTTADVNSTEYIMNLQHYGLTVDHSLHGSAGLL